MPLNHPGSVSQPGRTQVSVDERSALPSLRGLPGWGALLTLLGFAIVASVLAVGLGHFGRGFAMVFLLGAVIAVLLVRNRSIFTAVVAPPIVMFFVIPIASWLHEDGALTDPQTALNIALPLVHIFPWMLLVTLVVLAIGIARMVLFRSAARARRTGKRATAQKARLTKTSAAKPSAPKASPAKPSPAKPSPAKSGPAKSGEAAPVSKSARGSTATAAIDKAKAELRERSRSQRAQARPVTVASLAEPKSADRADANFHDDFEEAPAPRRNRHRG